jgi:putative iron-only hydrogenase system regulator
MEKRIGTISIVIYDKAVASTVNSLLSEYADSILARQGLPLLDKGLHIITLIIESSSDSINALTGKLGRLENVEVKSILAKGKQKDGNNL